MASLSEYRRRRVWASIPGVVFGGGAAMATALATILLASWTQTSVGIAIQWLHNAILWGLVGGVVMTVALLILQTGFEYRRRTYDPTWALGFSETFFGDEKMMQTRSRAARSLKENRNSLRDEKYKNPELDDVLDLFEDIAFYVVGEQITPEVAHHAFHYWVRGYYSAAQPYLEVARADRPSQWEYIEKLYLVTQEVEIERNLPKITKALDQPEIDRFLEEEIDLI